MAVMIGNARISEFGTINGNKGDQTGREVMTQPWTSGGVWSYVFRPKSEAAAKKIAAAMVAACNNPNIGYSQRDRISLYMKASKNGFNLSKVGKCNCDCSSLVSVCVRAAGIAVSPYMYTGNEKAVLEASGAFKTYSGADYTKSSGKLKVGDILLRSGHTAIVTEGAAKPKKKTVATLAREVIAGKWGAGADRVKRLTAAGYDAKKVQKKVNEILKA